MREIERIYTVQSSTRNISALGRCMPYDCRDNRYYDSKGVVIAEQRFTGRDIEVTVFTGSRSGKTLATKLSRLKI